MHKHLTKSETRNMQLESFIPSIGKTKEPKRLSNSKHATHNFRVLIQALTGRIIQALLINMKENERWQSLLNLRQHPRLYVADMEATKVININSNSNVERHVGTQPQHDVTHSQHHIQKLVR